LDAIPLCPVCRLAYEEPTGKNQTKINKKLIIRSNQ
jgi:hypothetical protein